jgi:hypothetical protein
VYYTTTIPLDTFLPNIFWDVASCRLARRHIAQESTVEENIYLGVMQCTWQHVGYTHVLIWPGQFQFLFWGPGWCRTFQLLTSLPSSQNWFLEEDICSEIDCNRQRDSLHRVILISVEVSVAYNFQSGNNRIKLLPCGLVVSVPGYRSRGPGFDSRRYKFFWEVLGLQRGPLSLVSITRELLEWKSSGSGSRKPRLTAVGIRCADHATPSNRKSWH